MNKSIKKIKIKKVVKFPWKIGEEIFFIAGKKNELHTNSRINGGF